MAERIKEINKINKAQSIIDFMGNVCMPNNHAVVVISSKDMSLMRLHNDKPCDVDRINGSGRALDCLVSGATMCRNPKTEDVWVVHKKQGEMNAFLYKGGSVFPKIKSLQK